MIISAHQPGYIPWIGYFDKIKKSDLFVYMDTVQLTNSSSFNFVTRNYIKSSQGPQLLTVPIKKKGFMNKELKELEIDYSQNWVKKHLRTIETNYRKSNNYSYFFPKLKKIYDMEINHFTDFCYEQLIFFLKEMDIKTKIIKLSDISTKHNKSDLILEICMHFKAKQYIAGGKSMEYLNVNKFLENKIEIIMQNFKNPLYKQLHGSFIENMSIIDYLMNESEPTKIF